MIPHNLYSKYNGRNCNQNIYEYHFSMANLMHCMKFMQQTDVCKIGHDNYEKLSYLLLVDSFTINIYASFILLI